MFVFFYTYIDDCSFCYRYVICLHIPKQIPTVSRYIFIKIVSIPVVMMYV